MSNSVPVLILLKVRASAALPPRVIHILSKIWRIYMYVELKKGIYCHHG